MLPKNIIKKMRNTQKKTQLNIPKKPIIAIANKPSVTGEGIVLLVGCYHKSGRMTNREQISCQLLYEPRKKGKYRWKYGVNNPKSDYYLLKIFKEYPNGNFGIFAENLKLAKGKDREIGLKILKKLKEKLIIDAL